MAGLEVEGSPFFLHEVNPETLVETHRAGVTSCRVEVFVDSPDGFIARAIAAGATAGSATKEDQIPWGTHRQGRFKDPFGHNVRRRQVATGPIRS